MAGPILPLITILFLLLLPASFAIRCYQCEGHDCSQDKIPLVNCPANETLCVTLEVNRYHIIRDCAGKYRRQAECGLRGAARRTCKLCDKNACNMQPEETLICRACNWAPRGSCPLRRRCHVPYGTSTVLCYAVYHRLLGFEFGCTSEASPEAEHMMQTDKWGIWHRLCDSHDCNDRVTFLPVQSMFDRVRSCYHCEEEVCGYKMCPDPHTHMGMFCFREWVNATFGCFSALSALDQRKMLDQRLVFLCATHNCNTAAVRPKRMCIGEGGGSIMCPLAEEHCVAVRVGATFQALGCSGSNPCFDKDRCFHCENANNCNDPATIKRDYVLCYDCRDQAGCLRVRDHQSHFLKYCYGTRDCFWATNGRQQMRACGYTTPPGDFTEVRRCTGNGCNQAPSTAICYACQENSRECLYSQTHNNLQQCAPGVESCFVQQKEMGMVERGCGSRANHTNAVTCHNATLCNDQSTVSHACHIYETDFDFAIAMDAPARIDLQAFGFATGWAPNTCTDVGGMPACYMSFQGTGMRWGCMGDVKHIREKFYGAKNSDVFLSCEGDYCNFLP